ncbi:MAG: Inositol monophosphatase family protein [Candidatus Magasanikbacteria bacterium GW2011_GWA2_46_17]|uniref:Inositol-1-monophosphatase n=1 Tax=Candidatus Magasanikbacteria bacterium GW2011_GWA2_46_17 TaxID=1619042 RepID=A0A0G1RB92_9BACT|nr:MAG: Inositol monophosphatase family protein [Candidatus Magasanikbacteria bacterium GW2011_GWA2_46_17]
MDKPLTFAFSGDELYNRYVYISFLRSMLKIAIKAARAGGAVLKKYFNNLDSFEYKNKQGTDLVTKADRESEDIIKKILLDKYPNHGFWGEETGKENIKKEYVWLVDPLDGTSNYILGIPMFSVSIGLLRRGQAVLGVVYVPTTGEMFWAKKGEGAFCNNKKIKVSSTRDLGKAACSVEYWSRDSNHIGRGLKDFSRFAKSTKKIRYLSSTVFELCRVANGNLDFCLLDTTFLDLAAPKLIVEEAGGVCRDYSGDEMGLNSKNPIRIIASNKNLYKKIKGACSL